MTVKENAVAVVFSSKFVECVPACANIVTDQVSGNTAVSVSPVWARLKPRVSRTGRRCSACCVMPTNVYAIQTTMTKVEKKKNQNVK